MSTQVGNTIKTLGKEYNIASSNVGGDKILNSEYLKENTLIIDAKVDNNLYDKGSYSLFITDGDGKAVRLTYTMQPGNGLYIDNSDTDILKMYIEGNSIKSEEGTGLYVDTSNIIDNDTIQVYNDDEIPNRPNTGRFRVVTANLDKATDIRWGIVKSDENTTYINYLGKWEVNDGEDYANRTFTYELDENNEKIPLGTISVNTQHLDTVDDESNRDGIIKHNSEMARTIKAVNGKLDVITANLEHADDTLDIYGITKGDEKTIDAKDGVLSVNTQGLTHANSKRYGTVKLDGKTIEAVKLDAKGNPLKGVLEKLANNEIIKVNTRNLDAATKDEAGVIRYDDWSIGTADDGRLEVKRFQEIESLLENNGPEHAKMEKEISELLNRVVILEIEAFSEKIEFLTPIGNDTTELPEPVFDVDTWSIKNKYSEQKTVAFQIKTNCKYKVNIEYKEDSNKHGQVQLATVKVGDEELIPANSLEETIFDATDKTVQTLHFTFTVSNYDADDNIAFSNTNVIFTATSINDDAIYQQSFHIFKCWNNKAYELDKPNFDNENIVDVDLPSYWMIYPQTQYVEIYENGYQTQTASVDLGQTSSKNFFFNKYTYAAYLGKYSDEDNNYTYKYENIAQPILANNVVRDMSNNEYNNVILTDWHAIDCFGNGCDDAFTYSIISSYTSTKLYNAIKIESKKPLTVGSRSLKFKLYPTGINYAQITAPDQLTNNIEAGDPIKRYINLIGIINPTVLTKTEKNILDNINLTSHTDEDDGYIREDILVSILTGGQSKDAPASKPMLYAGKYESLGATKNANLSSNICNIIKDDLLTVNTLCIDFKDFIKENNLQKKNPEYITDKSTYVSYWTYTHSINSYVDNILQRIKDTRNIIRYAANNVKSAENNYIEFEYIEEVNAASPVINIDFNVDNSGISYIMSRNADSLYSKDGMLTLQYVFTNKKGDNVDADGKPFNGNEYYSFNMNVPENTTIFKGKYTPDFFESAATGYSDSTTDKVTYFNVIVMDGGVEDRISAWPWSNRDVGYCWWGGYDSVNNKSISSITDNIYMVYRLKGRDAGTQGYYTLNWKGRTSGDYDYLAKSNWLCWEGLAKDGYWNTGSATIYNNIKIGGNYYMTAEYAKSQLNGKVSVDLGSQSNAQLAKLYYDTYKSSLVYTTTKVPIKVANGVTGMKIVTIDTEKAPDYKDRLPGVTYKMSGLWSSSGNYNVTTDKPFTFGNAYISAVTIDSWDDFEMVIKFTISGGTDTNLPEGTQFSELKQTNNGSTKFIFLVGSKSYNDTYYYDSKEVTYSVWKNNSCVVTYKLYNDYSLNKDGIYTYKAAAMYDKGTSSPKVVYLKTDTKTHTTDKLLGKIASYFEPDLLTISGIKAWFGIQSNSISLQMNFESSTSSNGVEIKFNDTSFSGSVAKNVNIINALYNSTITVTTTPKAASVSTVNSNLSTADDKSKSKSVTIVKTTNKLISPVK